jgi:hypothetical protein
MNELVGVVGGVLALLAACSSSSGGGASLNCGGGDTDCSCSVVKSGGKSLTCDGSLGGGAVCCASSGYPSADGSACVCQAPPKQASCTTSAAGDTCTCEAAGDGGASSCSLGKGVCCMAPGTTTCTCYASQTSCGASSMSSDHCDATVIAQNMALASFCAANQGPDETKVTACSPFKP